MINRIKALLRGDNGSQSPSESESDGGDAQLAAAALLVEAACLDGHFGVEEQDTIRSLLETRFGLSGEEVETLVEEATNKAHESSQLYAFTRVIKDRFEHEERVHMIEMLWEVAYADGHLHDYESNLVRRVSGLVYVPDRESGDARKRVLARMNKTS